MVMRIWVDAKEFLGYEKAFNLLGEVADDLENYGEVMQDETIEKIEKFFKEVGDGNYQPD
jgi:hypothetical protein